MALQIINLGLPSASRINKIFLAPIDGQSASIMELLFIKMDKSSATGINKIFLAPMDGQRVVGRAQV